MWQFSEQILARRKVSSWTSALSATAGSNVQLGSAGINNPKTRTSYLMPKIYRDFLRETSGKAWSTWRRNPDLFWLNARCPQSLHNKRRSAARTNTYSPFRYRKLEFRSRQLLFPASGILQFRLCSDLGSSHGRQHDKFSKLISFLTWSIFCGVDCPGPSFRAQLVCQRRYQYWTPNYDSATCTSSCSGN